MHKILVAFDGSPSALRAVRYIIGLAKQIESISVHVVTAHEEPILYGEIAVYDSRERIEKLQREHGETVILAAEQLLREAAVPYIKEILVGRIAEAIVKRADELQCDGIVMGTHGMTAIGNLLMGSVATKIIHLATMPVTLVK